jgi:hypothetical protein
MLNFADYLDQSLYQKSVESRRLIERVTQQQRKACRFQRDNNLRDRNLNEGEIVILNIDDTLADMPGRFITCRRSPNLESVFRGMGQDRAIRSRSSTRVDSHEEGWSVRSVRAAGFDSRFLPRRLARCVGLLNEAHDPLASSP